MPRYLRTLFRMNLACVILAGFLMLGISCAKGDMLLFATAVDCETAPVSTLMEQRLIREGHGKDKG